MMRIVTIGCALAFGAFLYAQNGLPQVTSKASKGSFSGYTGAVGHAIGPLKN